MFTLTQLMTMEATLRKELEQAEQAALCFAQMRGAKKDIAEAKFHSLKDAHEAILRSITEATYASLV